METSKESGNLEWYGVNITKVVLDASDLADKVNAAYDSYSDQEEDLEEAWKSPKTKIKEAKHTYVSNKEFMSEMRKLHKKGMKGAGVVYAFDDKKIFSLGEYYTDYSLDVFRGMYKLTGEYAAEVNRKPDWYMGNSLKEATEYPYIKMPSNTKNPDDWDWEHWDLWDETDKELFPPYDTDEDYDDYEIDELDGLEFDGHEVLFDGKAVGFTGESGEAIFNAYSGCPSKVIDYFYDKGYTVRKPYSERKRKVVESKEDPTDEEQTKEFEPSDATIEPAGILKDMNKVADPCDKGNTDGVAHVDEDGHLKKVTESSYGSYDGWSQEDIDLHKSIDWDANHYRPYDAGDAFEDDVYYYGTNPEDTRVEKAEFHKFINANPIYPPYYAPVGQTKNDEKYTWSMYDGRKHGNYDKHDRRETYDLYTSLSK